MKWRRRDTDDRNDVVDDNDSYTEPYRQESPGKTFIYMYSLELRGKMKLESKGTTLKSF